MTAFVLSKSPLPSPDRFDSRWLAEALRLREAADGRVRDAHAVAAAREHRGDAESRVLLRASLLGDTDGLAAQIEAWRGRTRIVFAVLAAIALIGGFGAAVAAVGDGSRPVNVVWSLGALLGVHVLMLLLWFASFLVSAGDGGGALGRLWLWLSTRFASVTTSRHVPVALLALYRRERLVRWWLGTVTHGLWTAALGGVALGLLLSFALRAYGFVWETTILPVAMFERLVAALGWLPSQVGFAVPDADMVRASGLSVAGDEMARRAWASWLLGCVVVYGMVPRALLWAACAAQVLRRRSRTRLDLGQPGYAQLLARLTPTSERIGVTDSAPARIAGAHVADPHAAAGQGAVMVGIELRDDLGWPPLSLPGVRSEGVIESREQRRRVLADFARNPPARLLIVCDPRLSPDRGSLALLAELADHADAARIWLFAAERADTERLAHWRAGLAETGFDRPAVVETEHDALAWLQGLETQGIDDAS